MSETSTKIRKARKDRQCSEHAYHTIKKGDHYLHAAYPPWFDGNDTRKWWIISACLRCADTYNMHTSETRKQAELLKTEAGGADHGK